MRSVRNVQKKHKLQTSFVDLQNLKGLGEMSCDFTRESSTKGVPSQVTVLCGKHQEGGNEATK